MYLKLVTTTTTVGIRKVLVLLTVITIACAKKSLYDFKINDITGQPVNLVDYKQKALLIFNTASQCGYTDSHLKALNRLHRIMQTDGKLFEILAFPCNDFGEQEPGSAQDIEMFIRFNYKCTFPIMEKVSVVGESMHPLWKYIIQTSSIAPTWNFHKYLFDANGKFVNAWGAQTSVQSIFEDIKKVVDESSSRNEL